MSVHSSTKRRPLPDQHQAGSPDDERPVTLQNPLAVARGTIVAVILALIVWVVVGAAVLAWVL